MKPKFLYRLNLLLAAFFVFAAAVQLGAQTGGKTVFPSAEKLQTDIAAFVEPFLEMRDLSGAILVSQNGKTLYAKGFGAADLEKQTPVTVQTRFRIGSLNKQLTAAAVLLLEEKGKLKTSDPVSKFFPDFPNGDKITLEHLLTHRSGLTKYVPYKQNGSAPSPAELVKIIGSLPPEAKPGERYNYSNAGFVLLALVVEQVSGRSFPQFLAENIFKPLGMKNSGVGKGDGREYAKGYVTGVDREISPAPSLDVFNYEVFSTVEDLNKWQVGLYGGRLLSPAALLKMTTDHGDRYGYGLSVRNAPRRSFGHDGVTSGYNGFVTFFPDEKLSVVYLGNIESGALGELQTNLPSIAFGGEFKVPKIREPAKKPVTADFQKFVGRYEVFPGFYLDVKFDRETLSLRGPLGAFIALTPLSENEFFYRHLYAKVTFVKDENQKIARLDWTDASGGTYPCKKISSEY